MNRSTPSHDARLRSLTLLALPVFLKAQNPSPAPIPSEIFIADDCSIVTLDLRNPAAPRPRHRHDPVICHIEGYHSSSHWEKTIRNGVSKERIVDVLEREYVLQNPYPQRVTFVVHRVLHKHFSIDSEPRPVETTPTLATFRVLAEPGQIVSLHVGERD